MHPRKQGRSLNPKPQRTLRPTRPGLGDTGQGPIRALAQPSHLSPGSLLDLDSRWSRTQTSSEMRTRVVSVAVLAALIGAGVSYTAAASGRARIASCSVVRVSGGDFNAATGGQAVAAVQVRNLGRRDCTISGRPWIRLGPLRHAVTVEDATIAVFGSNAGVPGRVLRLRPGRHAYADILIQPGSCGLARSQVFALRARAGWGKQGVPISDLVCKNGTGEIWVGSFQRRA